MEEVKPVNTALNMFEDQAPALSIRGLSKIYHTASGRSIEAVSQVDLDIAPNSFVCLVGPSGCGKSTLLRIMAGLDQASEGQVVALGRPQDRPGREIGMIFQEYSLFPWRTILENITIGPEFNGVPDSERRRAGLDYLELIGMKGYENTYPHELSGGMRQRVAHRPGPGQLAGYFTYGRAFRGPGRLHPHSAAAASSGNLGTA